MSKDLTDKTQSNKLSIRNESGEELLVENESGKSDESLETLLASDGNGNSLTLLEELSLRKNKSTPSEFLIAFVSAVASLAFATLIYLKTI